MRKNVILIDFENVQPESLGALTHEHFRVLVFVGANQSKIPYDVAASLQQLGGRAEYVKIAGNGSNALDFHIAYYIGVLAAEDPTAYFHIVSKDKGFDPLIQHLKAKKILAGRAPTIAEIPAIRNGALKSAPERAKRMIEKLSQPKATKPRTVTTLSRAVNSLFQKQLSEEEVAEVVQVMAKRGVIVIDGTKVTYPAALGA